ncbi:hypothetical protein F5883DRAFT_646746 [Diaporthe sp. PMI_573]|nr:hypothetical protein F5883DRAFT_646746 [Diaporthaceae sp. PMI_573]
MANNLVIDSVDLILFEAGYAGPFVFPHHRQTAYKVAVKAHGGDPSSFPELEWSPEAAITSMEAVGASLGILSVSSPGVPVTGAGEEGRRLARELNINLGALATSAEGPLSNKLGFFGKLCSGVGAYTSYGNKLPGHEGFRPIWGKLQGYGALVFLHPTSSGSRPRFIGGFLPQPVVDYPLTTTRAAVDLVFTGTMRSCPDIDVILSHTGGTLAFIGARTVSALNIPPIAAQSPVTEKEAIADFARFYYDIALSTSAAQLGGLLDFIGSLGGNVSHVLFGSDFHTHLRTTSKLCCRVIMSVWRPVAPRLKS